MCRRVRMGSFRPHPEMPWLFASRAFRPQVASWNQIPDAVTGEHVCVQSSIVPARPLGDRVQGGGDPAVRDCSACGALGASTARNHVTPDGLWHARYRPCFHLRGGLVEVLFKSSTLPPVPWSNMPAAGRSKARHRHMTPSCNQCQTPVREPRPPSPLLVAACATRSLRRGGKDIARNAPRGQDHRA